MGTQESSRRSCRSAYRADEGWRLNFCGLVWPRCAACKQRDACDKWLHRRRTPSQERDETHPMDISGTQQFTSSPQTVWDALHNSAILQSSIPGAQDVSWQGESALTLTIALPSVGPIGGTARAVTAQATENTPPSHMKLSLNRGPVAATATVDLAPNGSGTSLTYNANASLSGPLGMFEGAVKPVVEGQLKQFFTKFQQQVG